MCAGDPAPLGGTGLASQGKCLVGQPGWSRARLTPGCRRPTQAPELVVAWVLAAVTATGTCFCGVPGQALRGQFCQWAQLGLGHDRGLCSTSWWGLVVPTSSLCLLGEEEVAGGLCPGDTLSVGHGWCLALCPRGRGAPFLGLTWTGDGCLGCCPPPACTLCPCPHR